MNIVFLHCHFERGGVTQVVQNQVAAIKDRIDGQIYLASSGRNNGLSQSTVECTTQLTIPELEYDVLLPAEMRQRNPVSRAAMIVDGLSAAFESHGIACRDTVLHWHNHSLGKNVALPEAIRSLSEKGGFQQLLQVHDFAEDFRPENLERLLQACGKGKTARPQEVTEYCNPISDRIEYATLTKADRRILSRSGVPESRLHVLPNSVSLGQDDLPGREESLIKLRSAAGLPGDARWCVYPVRGIRRKNVGELLLLSQMMPEHTYAGITLPPATEIERASYERWRSVAENVAPRVVFDAGTLETVSFGENLSASVFVLSTSVAEGFGMAFLEPWLANRGVIARRLPSVVDDFVDEKLQLDQFYDSVEIPGTQDWVSRRRQESSLAFRSAWKSLPECFQISNRDAANQKRSAIDFAEVVPQQQIEILKRMKEDSGFHEEVRQRNAKLIGWLSSPIDSDTINQNRALIASRYSVEATGQQLSSLYQRMLQPKQYEAVRRDTAEAEPGMELICGNRPFYPCRTETEISQWG